jgi:hypothetical protein
MSQIMIYAAGGTGINIGSHFQKHTGQQEPGFAEIDVCYLDTSKSNLLKGCTEENTFIFDGADGSGKVKGTNYGPIKDRMAEVLNKFKPKKMNIILHSTSGGSGSVIGLVLINEMIARNELFIVISVGSTNSEKELSNTLGTLQSYDNIGSQNEHSVPVAYFENSKETPRGHVDINIHRLIVSLSALFSGQNNAMDSSDLKHWIQYEKVTNHPAGMVSLEVFNGVIQPPKDTYVVSVATLTLKAEGFDPDINNIPVGYQTVGYVPEDLTKIITIKSPVHYCLMFGPINQTVERLSKVVQAYTEQAAMIKRKALNAVKATAQDDGVVL